jgi:hypothetical protein
MEPTKEHKKYGYESAVSFISDRDEPMAATALSAWHQEITGRPPTADELAEMRPDAESVIREQVAWYRG